MAAFAAADSEAEAGELPCTPQQPKNRIDIENNRPNNRKTEKNLARAAVAVVAEKGGSGRARISS